MGFSKLTEVVSLNLDKWSSQPQPPPSFSGTSFIKHLAENFARDSSLHGIKYIGQRDLHIVERIFWLMAFLGSFGLSIFLVQQVYQKYNDTPIIISFQPMETHISQIPFPAVTLCNVNMMKRQRGINLINEFKRKFELYKSDPSNATSFYDTVVLNEDMASFCLAAPSFLRLINEVLVDFEGNPDFVEMIQDQILAGMQNGTIPDLSNYTQSNSVASDDDYWQQGILTCKEMIVKCMWEQKMISCDEVFEFIATQFGRCCVFNKLQFIKDDYEQRSFINETDQQEYFESNDDNFEFSQLVLNSGKAEKKAYDQLRYQKSGGKTYGLSILINPDITEYSTCTSDDAVGFKMVAHSPISFPNMDYAAAVPPNSEVYVDIEPELTTANEDNIGSIDISKRSCYFSEDKETKLDAYKFYSATNCMQECIAKLTFKNCNCIRHFMPGDDENVNSRLYNVNEPHHCGSKKLNCSEEVRVGVMTGSDERCSHCLPSCTQIQYKMQVSYLPLYNKGRNEAFLNYKPDNETKLAANYTILHIFIGMDSINAKERSRLYDFWDLLANTGGLLGFTLGFSLISLVEIVYSFTVRALFAYRSLRKTPEDEDDDKLGAHNFDIIPNQNSKTCHCPKPFFEIIKSNHHEFESKLFHSSENNFAGQEYPKRRHFQSVFDANSVFGEIRAFRHIGGMEDNDFKQIFK